MFYSQCLLSRKGPLGAIWVAAYCFKKLKKFQVTETDISSSVDKILQDEVNVVTYRILAYLLLGIVRIYSKKVEYLFDDCKDVIIEISKFMVSVKDNTQMETLYSPVDAITLPDRFELDAFDLEIREDNYGRNVVSHEDITLKDGIWGHDGVGQCSLDKYHDGEVSALHDNSYANATPFLVRSMDIDMGPSTSLQISRSSQKECVNLEASYVGEKEPYPVGVSGVSHQFVEEKHLDHGRMSNEEHQNHAEQLKSPEMMLAENRKDNDVSKDHQMSISLDGTGLPNFTGIIMSDAMAITTPAAKERRRTSIKRKCSIDEVIVLPNKILRQSIGDASDLVSKRRKAPHNAYAAWKSSRIANLPHGFMEPVFSCVPLELRVLFQSLQKLEVPSFQTLGRSKQQDVCSGTDSKTVETPRKLEGLESPIINGSEQMMATPRLPSDTVGLYEKFYPSEPFKFASEQMGIAPETPIQRMSLRSFGSPENVEVPNLRAVSPASSDERIDNEPYMSKDRDQNLDFRLRNKDLSLCGEDDQELDGWSERTRIIARYLHSIFLDQNKQRGEEVLKLLHVLKGRTKKESARVFNEILILKTKGCVDVKQDDAYGEILVWKLPNWDEHFGADINKTNGCSV